MGYLPNVKSIRIEDIGTDVPKWINNLLSPLNSFLESVYTILNKGINFDNISCKVFEFTFKTKGTYSSGGWDNFSTPSGINSKVSGVILLAVNNISDTSIVSNTAKSVEWTEINGNITIQYISGLSNSTEYKVRLLFI